MKLYRIWLLLLIVAWFFVLTLLCGPSAKAQDASKESTPAEATPADKGIVSDEAVTSDSPSDKSEDVSWDDGAAPVPPNMKQPPKAGDRNRKGDKREDKKNRPDRERFDGRPPMGGPAHDMNRPDGERPVPPPMDGPNPDRFNHGPEGVPPQGRENPRNRSDVMGPPPTGPFQNWDELEKADPEFFKMLKKDAQLERKTRQLTMQYRQTTDEKSKEEIGKKLAQTVAEHFDIRQKRRAMELERLEKELNRLKTLFEKRNQSRDKIIEDRIKELRGEEESLF